MKRILLITVLLTAIILSCNVPATNETIEIVNADSLIKNIKKYSNKTIEIEGLIVHVCGVDGKKMKLKTENGDIIKIVPFDSTLQFNNTYNSKTIRVQGKITEFKLEKNSIDSLEKEKKILCHIDNTPCKDREWVENKIKKGIADSLSKRGIDGLKEKMLRTGDDYVTVLTMVAEKIKIKDENKTIP